MFEKEKIMKKMRFIVIATIVALLFGSFAVLPGIQKSVAGTAPQQSLSTAALIPDFSPFLLSASGPVITAIGVEAPANAVSYACTLLSQKPADWTTMKKRTSFDASWVIQNTGSKVWGTHGIDIIYIGGTRMHTGRSLFDLPKQVGPGQKIKIAVDMIAPKQPGYYVSNWGLNIFGGASFCRFYVVIYVSG